MNETSQLTILKKADLRLLVARTVDKSELLLTTTRGVLRSTYGFISSAVAAIPNCRK